MKSPMARRLPPGPRKIFPGRKAYVETFFRKFSKGGKGNGNRGGNGNCGGTGNSQG